MGFKHEGVFRGSCDHGASVVTVTSHFCVPVTPRVLLWAKGLYGHATVLLPLCVHVYICVCYASLQQWFYCVHCQGVTHWGLLNEMSSMDGGKIPFTWQLLPLLAALWMKFLSLSLFFASLSMAPLYFPALSLASFTPSLSPLSPTAVSQYPIIIFPSPSSLPDPFTHSFSPSSSSSLALSQTTVLLMVGLSHVLLPRVADSDRHTALPDTTRWDLGPTWPLTWRILLSCIIISYSEMDKTSKLSLV